MTVLIPPFSSRTAAGGDDDIAVLIDASIGTASDLRTLSCAAGKWSQVGCSGVPGRARRRHLSREPEPPRAGLRRPAVAPAPSPQQPRGRCCCFSLIVGPEQKPERWPGQPMTRVVARDGSSVGMSVQTGRVARKSGLGRIVGAAQFRPTRTGSVGGTGQVRRGSRRAPR